MLGLAERTEAMSELESSVTAECKQVRRPAAILLATNKYA
jgi:hypothetical protein